VPTLDETVREILNLQREAGTPEAAKARELATAYLSSLGYRVAIQKFTFAPASLRAFPIFGAGLGWLALALFPLLAFWSLPSWTAGAVWIVGLTALIALSAGVGLGWAPLGEALREDANLIATRGEISPRRWIVAHLDSKAQAQSMAGRLVAVWVVGLAIAISTTLTLIRLRGPVSQGWAAVGAIMALVAGLLAGRGRLQGRSHGARDNGTGIVAALTAAASAGPEVGILITGAEEFGLVGSRVFARLSPGLQGTEFVNVDTIDQEGKLALVSHDARGERLARLLEPRLAGLALPIRRRRLPLGIFVDSAPLARIAPAITIGRLTWRTLRRIHTPSDTVDGLSYRTAEQVGRVIAQGPGTRDEGPGTRDQVS
jgi:peptidase M28-like protein